MSQRSRSHVRALLACTGGAALLLPFGLSVSTASAAAAPAAAAAEPGGSCSPTPANRPVCAADAPTETASFLDPTAVVTDPADVRLGKEVYVGPFAQLLAEGGAGIELGAESNAQDNVTVQARVARSAAVGTALAAAGLQAADGVVTGERVILAHGSSVVGPARLGVAADGTPAGEDSGVFVSFGARVDGAVLERDSGLSALSRIGPGLRLRSGLIVLPGKDVRTQQQAEDPALGKVRPITQADRLFNAGVVEVNVGLAREYSRLAREQASAVRGINVDPGGNVFDQTRDAPQVESGLCTGPEVRLPEFRNRIIGDACFEDSLKKLDKAMGSQISIRADEGGPFGIGTIKKMGDKVVFHALEGADLEVGQRVTYGRGAIVHGGGRPTINPTTGFAAPTVVGNDVRLGDDSVVFRSLIGNRARIGARSAVVGSELAIGQVIPDRTIYANNGVFGRVEW